MKVVSILAAAALALSPVMVSAGSDGDSNESTENQRPISGPLAGRDIGQPIPVGALAAGGGLVAAIILCVVICDSGDSTDSTTATNGAVED